MSLVVAAACSSSPGGGGSDAAPQDAAAGDAQQQACTSGSTSTQPCTIDHGQGTATETCVNGAWSAGPCAIASCDAGYILENGTCVMPAGPVIYIDPSAATNGSGTEASPWNASTLPNDPWVANTTYLFKRGTTYTHTNKINIQPPGITFASYGKGPRPIIEQTTDNDNIIGAGSVTFADLELYSPNSTNYDISFMYATGDVNVLNCKIHGGGQGVRFLVSPTVNVKVENCEIFDMWSDGMFITSVAKLEVSHCKIYNVNLSFATDLNDGDIIQTDDIPSIWIHHNILDHSSHPGKFCILLASGTSTFVGNAIVEYNVITRARNGEDHTMFYSNWWHGSTIILRYNKFSSAMLALQSRTYDMQVYYNEFSDIQEVMELSAPTDFPSHVKFFNNTIYNSADVLFGYGEFVDFENNIVHTSTTAGTSADVTFNGGSNITLDYNVYYLINHFGNIAAGSHDITADPSFVDTTDFYLNGNSPALNAGANLGLKQDLGGNSVDATPNIGCREANADVNFPFASGGGD